MENSNAEKKSSKRTVSASHTVFSVLYGLNDSYSKLITAGYEISTSGDAIGTLVPVVKILNSSFAGVKFNTEGWGDFKNVIEKTMHYFQAPGQEAEKLYGTRVQLLEHKLLFTTCYNSRAVSIGVNDSDDVNESVNPAFREPAVKRGYRYSPNIVLQQVSFERIIEMSKCIDLHLESLVRNCEGVNFVIKELVLRGKRELSVKEDEITLRSTVVNWLKNKENIDSIHEQILPMIDSVLEKHTGPSLKLLINEISTVLREYIVDCIVTHCNTHPV